MTTAHDDRDQSAVDATAGPDRRRLLGLVMLMVLAGLALAAVGGPPRMLSDLPRPERVGSLLVGSTLPLQPIAALLVDLAWLIWIWIVGSFGLEASVMAAEHVTRGAGWVRSLRGVSNRLSLPVARKAVAAAFAVQVLSRSVPIAAAAPLSDADTALVVHASAAADARAVSGFGQPRPSSAPEAAAVANYLVKPGDTLWSIAEQAYGSGSAYRRLVDANLGRRMADGQTFTARGVIQPGWDLLVPDPVAPPAPADLPRDDGPDWYTVQAHDTLSSVAASTRGDRQRWPELFEANRGAVTPDGRHTLTDPNLIWPGLRLRLVDPDPEQVEPEVMAPPDQGVAPDASAPPDGDPAPDAAGAALPPAASPAAPDGALDELRTDSTASSVTVEPAAHQPDADEGAPELDQPPLTRAVHALDPIVLEPADLASIAPDAGSSSGGSDVVLPTDQLPGDRAVLPAAAGTVGLLALGGAALVVRRKRRLRRLSGEPESEVVVEGGFAEVQLARDLARGLHGVGFDPLGSLVSQLEHFLDEYQLGEVNVVAVRQGRSAISLVLAAGLAHQPLLLDVAPAFASRLESDVHASLTADHDVVWRLVRLRKTRLLPGAAAPASDQACLVPLGVLYDRQVYAGNWRTLGHILVASLPGHGADTILTSLVATLSARRSPQQMQMWLLARPRALPAPLFELPHLARWVDTGDESALAGSIQELRGQLEQRARSGYDSDVVVVVPELTELGEHAAELELLASQAASLGVRFIAGTSCPEAALLSPLLAQFGTRLVLRMQDEEASVALLGVADAAFLGGGGRLLLRLDGREPVELYGYQVAAEHLDRLVRVMRSAYPALEVPVEPRHAPPLAEPPDEPSAAEDVDGPAAAEPSPPPAADASAPTPAEAPPTAAPQPAPPATVATDAGAVTPPAPQAPPLRVVCFGGPRILCGGEQVWPRLPAGEVKPWEFLLYLACQPADGVSSEDAVEALWPEDDQAEQASHRFRQLRYRLRRLLSGVDGAPETDGICFERGTLRLDPAIIWSDAREFLSLVRTARLTPGAAALESLEQARALYAGDLLEGPDARRYAWLDERDDSGVTLREHFRRLFQQASLRLAELYALRGDLEAARDVYHELTEMDPGDERYWRGLFRLHAERGDRLSLVREEHRMRQALRELAAEVDAVGGAELGDPSRELVQEYQRLLAGLRDANREAATA